jgi:ABC-type multidrug transport system ATPase subunit
MGEAGGVYVLDEPTTGLHLADLRQLLGLLDRLVDSGKSVIVIEHHQAVMAHADWIIDLGPGAGHDGGRVVFEGPPADLVAARSTLTGEHLGRSLAAVVRRSRRAEPATSSRVSCSPWAQAAPASSCRGQTGVRLTAACKHRWRGR